MIFFSCNCRTIVSIAEICHNSFQLFMLLSKGRSPDMADQAVKRCSKTIWQGIFSDHQQIRVMDFVIAVYLALISSIR